MDENYGIGISLNIDGIQPQIQGVEKMITDLQKFTDEKMKIVNQTITNGAAAGIEEFTKKMEALKAALAGVKVDESLVNALLSISNIAGVDGANISVLANAMSSLTQSMSSTQNNTTNTQSSITQMGNAATQTSTDFSALAQMIAQVTLNVNNSTAAINKLSSSLEAIKNSMSSGASLGSISFDGNSKDFAVYKQKCELLHKINEELLRISAAEQSMASDGLSLTNEQKTAQQQLQTLQASLITDITELEKKGIDEITEYRKQREAEANMAILANAAETEKARLANAKAQQAAKAKEYETSYQGVLESVQKIEDGKVADTYENRAKAIKQLREALAKLNAQDSQYERKMGDLIEKLRKLTAQQKAYEEAVKSVNSATKDDALAAVNKANQTRSLKDMTAAYKMLKKAMENMDVKSSDWKKLSSELKVVKGNIDRVKQAMGELKGRTSELKSSMQTLTNYMLAAFSVQQITGYIKKMVNVRAQFELQNTALRAILQNKDEADRIFRQVQDMAMQSPFTIMQLTTYTKQLAAYRIEAEKLVGTTKMLADVSAGLGVDIQRLILAYGQVKSANYLRATEVRQFTEAGLNIAGELSEYLSEVNGKMISVADVMDMISKRMVKFEDVEEVFNRITSAGGIFYDMQKKQADTLYGQIQRISDALSLMMNDIGQSNEGIIKGALSHIRELIKSWREFIPLVYEAMATLGLLGTVKAIQGLAKIGSTVRKLITSMRLLRVATDQATAAEIRLQNTSKMFWANVGWTAGASAAIALILTVVNGIINMNAELRAFRENLSRIETESTADMNHSVKRFGELADTIRDATKTYDEKRAAMEELQRTYKDILPDQMLQIENIKSMADGYQEATEAIREYYTENLKQKSREALDQQQQDAFKKWQDTLTNFAVSLKKLNDLSVSDAEIKGLFQRFSDQVYNEILNGQTKIESAEMRFRELLQNYFGLEDLNVLAYNEEINKHYDLLESIFNRFTTEIFDKFSNELIQFNERIDDAATLAEKQQREQAKGVIAEYETAKGKVNEYVSALEKVNDLQKKNKLTKEDGTYTELGSLAMKELEDAVKTVNALRKVLGLVPLDFEAVKKSISSTLAVEMSTQKTLNETLTKWIGVESDKITTTTEENGQTIKKFTNDYLEGVLEKELRNINKLDLSDTQKEIQKLIKKAGEMNNVELGNFRFAMLTTQSTVHSVRTEVEAEIKELETSIKEYDNAMATGWAASTAPMFFLQGKTKEEIQTYIKALKDLRDALGGMDNQHSGADKVKKEWQDRIKAIEDFYKQADTLEKHFDISTTTQKLTESFNKLFDQLKLGTGELSELGLDKLANGIYNPEALMKALQKLKEKIPAGYQDVLNSLEKTISDTSIQIGIDVQTTGLDKLKTEVDDVFASYDLTKELQDLGLGVELTYLVGGKPMTKEDLENYVNTTLKDLLVTQKKYGDDGVKAYEDYVKKLTQVENKEREDRIKSYSKYLTKTYGELAKIRIDAYKQQEQIQRDFAKMGQDLQKMLDDPNVSTEDKLGIQKQLEQLPDQARRAAQGVNEEMNKALNDAEWKNFKDSGMLAMLSTDIENMTVKTLRSTKAMLEEQLTNGSEKTLAQQKEILNDIAKIIDQIGNKRPFTEFFKSAKKIRQLKKDVHAIDKDLRLWGEDRTNAAISTSEFIKSGFSDVKTETETLLGILDKGSTSSESFMVQLKKTASDAMENINSITTYLTKTKRLTTEQTDTLKAQRESWRSILSIVQKIQDKNGELDATTVGDIQTQLSGITDSADAGIVAFANLISWLTKLKNEQQNNEKQTKKWREVLTSACSAAAQNLGELSEMFQALGEDETSAKIFFLQFTQQILSAVPGIIAAFTAVNAAAGIIGIIAEAVSLLATSVTFWANAKEKKKEKAINNLKLEVEKLADAYDRLSDAMENATDIDAYNRDYEKAQTDIQARIEKYQDMLEIARSKKKKDASEIYEYEQAIAELEEESAELQKQRIQDLGGLGSGSDYKSQAEDWASAWLDAFKETGDGLDALNDNWEDFIDNLFVKQFVATKAAKVFEKYFKMIDDAIDAGFSGADLEGAISAALAGLESENEELNKLATSLAKVFGITQDGTDNLSDLQKGIQNITEDQAAAIESYMNSVRFYVAQQNDILLDLVNVLKSQYDQSDSPLLSVVKEIRSTLNAFSQRFSQVTRSTPNGWVVKVQ